MLAALTIRDIVLIEQAALEFAPGLNVLTGETGAGKSILIGALNLVLGERADRTLIRGGCESCSVEAVFNVTNLCAHKRGAPVSDPARRRNGLERAGSETGAPPLEAFSKRTASSRAKKTNSSSNAPSPATARTGNS